MMNAVKNPSSRTLDDNGLQVDYTLQKMIRAFDATLAQS
jgi:ABC-type uncharacterized transport system auxiliary subunit